MQITHDVLSTAVRPPDFRMAARRHGRHFARYLLAARQAKGTRVLDAACGSGFGAGYLAATAQFVLGLDLDEEVLTHARTHYLAPNVRFDMHDLHEPLPASHRPFDVLTCFETLEHVRDPRLCLTNLAAALCDQAVAFISVPNGAKELADQADKPYHQVHFTAAQFQQLLAGRFEQVEPFSEVYRKDWRHYLSRLIGQGRHHARNYAFTPGFDDRAKTWLAICHRPIRP
ncbi:MAG: class I SAM-dependent methyltransferase [Planctomycetaceae bacterium]|nr:class I SAM-dependent methyltransferase [Planctomycetaceae bacterium]